MLSLSLNDVPAVREIFATFTIESVETTYTIVGQGKASAAREVLISGGRAGELPLG